jgi:hypothetical protein
MGYESKWSPLGLDVDEVDRAHKKNKYCSGAKMFLFANSPDDGSLSKNDARRGS